LKFCRGFYKIDKKNSKERPLLINKEGSKILVVLYFLCIIKSTIKYIKTTNILIWLKFCRGSYKIDKRNFK